MYKFVCVRFESLVCAAFEGLLRSAAVFALAIFPGMFGGFVSNIAIRVIKFRDSVIAAGVFRTIECAPRDMPGQLCNCNAKQLLVVNVV